MANVLLNNVDHHDLAVRPAPGDVAGEVEIFPNEVGEVAREYPILLRREGSGAWRAVALLGLEARDNLYRNESGVWDAQYLPALVRRGPFTIAAGTGADGSEDEPVIHVDLDDPRVRRGAGEGFAPLFLPRGGNAPYLDHVAAVLRRIHLGHRVTTPMVAAFEAAGLVEPVKLEVAIDETLRYDLTGFHTVGEEALAALTGETLEELHRDGWLRLAFQIAGSLGNVARLANAQRRRRATT